jgi:hypothetical protein
MFFYLFVIINNLFLWKKSGRLKNYLIFKRDHEGHMIFNLLYLLLILILLPQVKYRVLKKIQIFDGSVLFQVITFDFCAA